MHRDKEVKAVRQSKKRPKQQLFLHENSEKGRATDLHVHVLDKKKNLPFKKKSNKILFILHFHEKVTPEECRDCGEGGQGREVCA